MTLRFTDGFDSYAATSDLIKKWLTNTSAVWNATAGRNGGPAITLASNSVNLRSRSLPNASNVFNFGFWFKATSAPNALNAIYIIFDASGNVCGYFATNTSGVPILLNLSAAQIVAGTSNMCDGNWHWIETYNTWFGSANGGCHVDGIQQWNGNVGVINNSFTPAQVGFYGLNGVTTTTYDDIICYDNSGNSPITSDYPLGPQQITTLRPSGDNSIQFSPDTGSTNYTQINEVNGDTTHYVQDGTSGHQDLYAYDDIGFSPAKIWGVVANGYLNNPGIGNINHNQVCKSNATTTTGTTTVTPVTNARIVQEAFGLDPNTAAAWTSSGLNSALFGIKVT